MPDRRTAAPYSRLGLPPRLTSSPQIGFPSITPIFGGMFLPGGNSTQLVTTDSWTAFSAQTDSLALSGYRLASLTAIQSLNRTFFYAAFEQGSGGYLLLRTTDPNAFQQTFAARKASSRLVDFSIVWEQGQLVYIGYWLAASSPKPQSLVWDVDFNMLGARWSDLSTNQGMRMTRVQAFPQQDAAFFIALFEQGAGGYVLWYDTLNNFLSIVEGKFAGASVVGLGYDPVNGMMVGCWRDKTNPSAFVWNLDWQTLSATAQKLAAKGLILRAVSVYPNVPQFDDYFGTNVGPFVRGYAYAVAKDGQIAASGAGFARGSHESPNPNKPFTADSRINLASVSKAVTGIALEALLRQKSGITLDSPFLPLIASKVPNAHPSVKSVTLRNLATMKSGLQPQNNEGPLDGDLWPYLNQYLALPLVGTPGVTDVYCNTNFTILQGVIDEVSGQDYVNYVTQNVLMPAGISPVIFNATPDASSVATLSYSGPNDQLPGQYWSPFRFVAPGGWISTARELVKILMALRGTSVLPADVIGGMLNDGIGWYAAMGNFGTYYHHNGGLGNGRTPPQQLNTCIVRLAEGYDVALVVNSDAPADVVNLCIGAFDSRGLAASDPAITAVVHGASFLSKASPGTFVSIFGAGFAQQPHLWSDAIPDGATLPLELDGIGVRVGSQDAYIEYVSPTQINILLPSNVPPGLANVQLTTAGGVFTSSLQIDTVAPGFFAYKLNGTLYAAALFANTAVYVAATGALSPLTSRPAKAGDILQLYGSGFGPTNPAAPDGAVLTQVYPTANLAAFSATLGGKPATVLFAGLTFAGAFQVNVQVPGGLSGGDQPLVLFVNNQPTQPNVMLSVQA